MRAPRASSAPLAVPATVTIVPGCWHKALQISLAWPGSSSTTKTILIPAVCWLWSAEKCAGCSSNMGANSSRHTRTLCGASIPSFTACRLMDRTLTVMSGPIWTPLSRLRVSTNMMTASTGKGSLKSFVSERARLREYHEDASSSVCRERQRRSVARILGVLPSGLADDASSRVNSLSRDAI